MPLANLAIRFSVSAVLIGLLTTTSGAVESTAANAADQPKPKREYYSVDVGKLIETFGPQHVVSEQPLKSDVWYQMDTHARVVVPSGSEAYVLPPESSPGNYQGYRIIGWKPAGTALSGQLFALQRATTDDQKQVLARFDFDVDRQVKVPAKPTDFLLAKGRHFQRLWSEGMAGSAMFRHLATTSLAKIGQQARSSGPNWPLRPRIGIDNSILLMSGGRAVSENLQLDARLGAAEQSDEMVRLSKVRGVTVREIDWTTRLSVEPTDLDPLVGSIPHDQHVILLPSFASLSAMIDRASTVAQPAVQWFEPQSRRTMPLKFYQQQLGLTLNGLTRQIGGALIDDVAITGSDPYFRTGTDLAVLMQTGQPDVLYQTILAQISASSITRSDVVKAKFSLGEYSVHQFSTPRRDICALVTIAGNTVIVSNSRAQLTKVLDCVDGKSKALDALDEYRFFRQRYRRDANDESALVIISDATIRRWCSPQWRIAASRRTRARATIAEQTMQHSDALIRDRVEGVRQLASTTSMPSAGSLWLEPAGVRSDQFGTLDFQTPIVEMDMTWATSSEVKLYESWRRRYEQQWRRAFDPIALKISLQQDSFSADLSVIPLMIRSQYRSWLQWIGESRLKPGTGDHHPESLASYDMAIDLNAPLLGFARTILNQQQQTPGTNIDLLGWIDGSISVYLDHDEEWFNRLQEYPLTIDQQELAREVPVGLYVPSNNSFRLAAFMVAVRGVLQSFAPNLIRWDQALHEGQSYVIATFVEDTLGDADQLPRGYYVTNSEGLTFSLNENVIKRAIERQLARAKAGQPRKPGEVTDSPATDGQVADNPNADAQRETLVPVGRHVHQPQLAARMTGIGAATFVHSSYSSGVRQMSRLAWSNIPILNYFRHRYPELDPAEVYQQLLGERLVEPGDGIYQWNERFQTYESSQYGHHLAPRVGPALSRALKPNDSVAATLSFDDGGLRAIMTYTQSQQ